MDFTEFVKIQELFNSDHVNKYLATGRWKVLAVSAGQEENGSAYMLYSLGWLGPVGDDDESEHPLIDSNQATKIDLSDVELWT